MASSPALPRHSTADEKVGLGKMMRNDLGFCVSQFRELIRHDLRDSPMDMLATFFEETFVRDLLHQSVLEGIGGFGREATAEHKPGRDELFETPGKLLLCKSRGRSQQVVRKSRPITAPICATCLATGSRSRRAMRDACNVLGTVSARGVLGRGFRSPSSAPR